jgi:hypothetical protein
LGLKRGALFFFLLIGLAIVGKATVDSKQKEAHLRKDDASVWVFDARDAPIGVYAEVRLFLKLLELLEDGRIGQFELFEEDGYFPRVGALSLRELGQY